MKVVYGIDGFQVTSRPVCVAIGTFDGLHRGHQAVIQMARETAARSSGEAVVTTFDPHPLSIIAPPADPFLLSTLDERIALFEATGVDALVILRFDQRLREIQAPDWLELIAGRLGARHIVVSSNHTFGQHRQGTVGVLQAWAAARNIGVAVVPPVADAGQIISSSTIRERLRRGDVPQAAVSLGRWYGVTGVVIRGEGRGRRLGVPTANVEVPREKLVPARGVYAAYATLAGDSYPAAVNIGVRPTFGGQVVAVEAHLLGVDLDLYGRVLTLGFVERLRDERAFPGPEALLVQIQADIASTQRLLAVRPGRLEAS